MSTTSRSPGSAPWTSVGPLSMWAWVRSTSRTSLAESLLPSWASVHSRHSTRNSLPGRTKAALGISGCQRLCPGTSWSRMDLDWSTLKTTSGMSGTFLAECGVGMPWRAWRGRAERPPRAAGSGHERQARARPYRRLAHRWRAACSRKGSTYALDAPPIEVRARRWWIDARFLPGAHRGTTRRTRPGDRTLDAAARRRARALEGARGQDSVAGGGGAGAGGPG